MSTEQIIVLAIVVVIVIYFIGIYNGLVNLKHAVTKAWANIDVLLKQRNEEIPKLVATCQQYMKYEQDTLRQVIEARSQVNQAQQHESASELGKAETQLRSGLGQLFALAESYPELQSNQSFQQLQQRISALENSIADRREFYNEAVNNNNVRIEEFPDVIIAKRFNFKAADLLEFEDHEKKDVDIHQLFNR